MPDDTAPDDGALEPLLELDAREAARARRRDHDLDAERRDLMRPGMGKVFKQIVDSIGDEATRARTRTRKTTRDDGGRH